MNMSQVFLSETALIRNNKRNKDRKTLKVLQPSATDDNVLVPSPIMVNRTQKEISRSNTFTIKGKSCLEKENSSIIRRSKRKNACLDGQPETEPSKEVSTMKTRKPKASKAISKSKAPATKTLEKNTKESQTSLDSFISVFSKISEEEVSKTADDSRLAIDEQTCVFKSVSDETDLLTSDVPSELYWRELAEQRRVALEKSLYENAQLVDQIAVLEVENGQLKSTINEFEKVIEIVKASL